MNQDADKAGGQAADAKDKDRDVKQTANKAADKDKSGDSQRRRMNAYLLAISPQTSRPRRSHQ